MHSQGEDRRPTWVTLLKAGGRGNLRDATEEWSRFAVRLPQQMICRWRSLPDPAQELVAANRIECIFHVYFDDHVVPAKALTKCPCRMHRCLASARRAVSQLCGSQLLPQFSPDGPQGELGRQPAVGAADGDRPDTTIRLPQCCQGRPEKGCSCRVGHFATECQVDERCEGGDQSRAGFSCRSAGQVFQVCRSQTIQSCAGASIKRGYGKHHLRLRRQARLSCIIRRRRHVQVSWGWWVFQF